MSRPPMQEYIVPVTIAEDRRVMVRAHSADEARRRVQDGKYVKLGRPINRGFLLVGKPERRET